MNVPPQLWMQLEKPVREHLAKQFNLKRTGVSEIRDQELISDGYSVEDLKAFNLGSMGTYVGSEQTDMLHAWLVTCSKARFELNPPVQVSQEAAAAMSQSPSEDVKEELPTTTTTKNANTKKEGK